MKTLKTCKELLGDFLLTDLFNIHNNCNIAQTAQKIVFQTFDNRDVYNISAPFMNNNELIIAGRVEDRHSEDSQVFFFKKDGDAWVVDHKLPKMQLQDPFIARIKGDLVLGGVEIYPEPLDNSKLAYRTVFFKGKSLETLSKLTQGPEGMKDIRLLELNDDRILVFTRPQGEIGGRGQIGYTYIKSLEELTPEVINTAAILENQFSTEEWGGANELHLLTNGWVGVLSHIACYDEKGDRHYYSSVFGFNPNTNIFTPMKLIATRRNFEDGPAKREDLKDVIFSGGLIRKDNQTATLYCGVSDAEAHCITIPDPFIEYEQL